MLVLTDTLSPRLKIHDCVPCTPHTESSSPLNTSNFRGKVPGYITSMSWDYGLNCGEVKEEEVV